MDIIKHFQVYVNVVLILFIDSVYNMMTDVYARLSKTIILKARERAAREMHYWGRYEIKLSIGLIECT